MAQTGASHFGIFDRTQTQYVHSGDVRLAYQSYGQQEDAAAETVLLIVGHGGQLHYWGDNLIEQLVNAGFHVLAFDNRDAGLSDKLEHAGVPNMMEQWSRWYKGQQIKATYTLEDMALDALGLLDELKIKQAHIIGASMGGMIAQIIAAEYPHRVRTLTSLMSTSSARHLSDPHPQVLKLMQTRNNSSQKQDERIASRVRFWEEIGSSSHDSYDYYAELVTRTLERCDYTPGLDRQLIAVWATGDRSEYLQQIKVPTLVIHGREDSLIPLDHGLHVAELVSDSVLCVIDTMGHAFQPEIIDEIMQSTIPFLQGQ